MADLQITTGETLIAERNFRNRSDRSAAMCWRMQNPRLATMSRVCPPHSRPWSHLFNRRIQCSHKH
ncbi:hypothetical protein Mapa_017358 [Marchantia paleacea]|nr:hypothetical protein Mapa_017358 [Marchantia paleacea]